MSNVRPIGGRVGLQEGGDNGNGGGKNIPERLSALEADMKHLATKADLQSMENKILKWQIGILVVVVLSFAGIVISLISVITRLLPFLAN